MRHLRDTNDKKLAMDKKKDCHRFSSKYRQKNKELFWFIK